MSKGGRFARIARDLEKLPPELIEPVLADLEYGQIVRVSQFGGPRVTWAIENSPAWSRFFRGKLPVLQQLDDLTNELITLCYSTGGFKNSPWYDQLSFLRYQKDNFRFKYPTDWASHWASMVRGRLHSVAQDLYPNFTETAYFLFPAGTPLNANETEEVEFFIDTAFTLYSLKTNNWPANVPPLPVLARWIALYKRVRHARLAAQAAELDRLVALHERHADRVKQPWAPQTRRPNPDHVVAGLRREAARLKRRNVDGRVWHGRELSGYRFRPAFAALVPYDWCLRLFCEVLKRHPVPEEEEEEGLAEGRGDGESSVYPPKVVEMMREALEGLPSFYHVYGERMLDPSRPETLRTARTPWSVSEPADGREGRFLTKRARGKNPFPHSDNELRWLETFVEVILWMEEHFPSLVNEVRGEEWEDCHGIEATKRRREERKRRKEELVKEARSRENGAKT
ncbi:Appr-1-p processing protein [Lasiodiplodia theobromae]|uniref:Appr-1-p processing protein n=1 Tax=Lasiodiplodia theobromae TaxID=45133 RepID=UPI0015C31547|nr:Appr-1-p processing protein [Lasiodiplodia theobromae]KAF4544904.1 Appr-1-p processing protein [Lasiodiplodia theobromae]